MKSIEDRITELYEKKYPPTPPKPCLECPFVRTAVPGYLGPHDAQEWCEIAHGEAPMACHMTIKRTDEDGIGDWDDGVMRQCKGMAIFRGNICKTPRNPSIARADQDYKLVFSWDDEFIAHHTDKPDET